MLYKYNPLNVTWVFDKNSSTTILPQFYHTEEKNQGHQSCALPISADNHGLPSHTIFRVSDHVYILFCKHDYTIYAILVILKLFLILNYVFFAKQITFSDFRLSFSKLIFLLLIAKTLIFRFN